VNIFKAGVIMVQGIVCHYHSEQWEKQFMYTDVHAVLCSPLKTINTVDSIILMVAQLR